MSWQLSLDDGRGGLLSDLDAFATARKFTKTRNDTQLVEFSLALQSPKNDAAVALYGALGGVPRARVYQDGELRFHAILAALKDDVSSDAMTVCTFKSPFGARLLGDGSSTGRFTSTGVTFTAEDQGQIVKSLIDTANSDSETGLDTSGLFETTDNQTIAYDRKNVGQAIVDLSQSDPAFDFEEVPQEDSGDGKLALFQVLAHQGTTLDTGDSAMFQHGAATIDNVTAVTRTWQPPANVVTVIGGNNLTGTASDAGSIAAYGKWPLEISAVDVTDQTLLDQHAASAVRANWIRVIGFTPDPARAPTPFVDYKIGDTVRLYVDRDALQISSLVRVDSIAVTVDDNGIDIAHELTVEDVT